MKLNNERKYGEMMNKMMTGAVIIAGLVIHTAHADVLDEVNNTVGASVGFSHMNYAEDDILHQAVGGGKLDSERGNQFAFQISAVRDGKIGALNNIYTSLAFSGEVGSLNYDGHSLADYSSMSLRHSSGQYDVTAKLGQSFRVMPQLQFTPYVSYTFHEWSRFDFESYNHHEVGVGVLSQYAVSQKFVADLDVNFSEVLGGKTHANGLETENLSSKPALSVTLAGNYKITPHFFLSASYNFRHFSYGQSSMDHQGTYGGRYSNTWFEPSSRTNTHTVMVGLKYIM